LIRSCAWRFIDPARRQTMAVSSTPGLAKPCLMFFPSLCTRFIGIRYATYPEGKRCANLDAVLGRGARWRGALQRACQGCPLWPMSDGAGQAAGLGMSAMPRSMRFEDVPDSHHVRLLHARKADNVTDRAVMRTCRSPDTSSHSCRRQASPSTCKFWSVSAVGLAARTLPTGRTVSCSSRDKTPLAAAS
jgi:hypothetical protein